MMRFEAHIEHTEDTLYKLSNVQYHTFCAGRIFLWMISAIICIVLAVYNGTNNLFFYIFMMLGCWMITTVNMPARRKVDRIIDFCKGKFPSSKYQFFEEHIKIIYDKTEDVLEYTKIYMLLEDIDYFYIFINRNAGYMLPKSSLRPQKNDEFKRFLEEKTSCTCKRPTTLMNMNIYNIFKKVKK